MKIPVEILFGRKFNLGSKFNLEVQHAHKGSEFRNLSRTFVVQNSEYNSFCYDSK
jgi:hypothetical protein